jgi:hypothetical protein
MQTSNQQHQMVSYYNQGIHDGYFSVSTTIPTAEPDSVDQEEDGLELSRYWTERLAKTVMRMEKRRKH